MMVEFREPGEWAAGNPAGENPDASEFRAARPSPERKWQMTRISAGDYILPSNDGKTLWRLSEYSEDGSAEWQDADGKWHKITGTFWQTARYKGRIGIGADDYAVPHDFLDWENWETVDTCLLKRKYAVEAVLNRG